MVRHGHAQGADSEPVEQLGQAHVAVRVGVPLRQHHQRPPLVLGRREPQRMDGVVLRVARADRAGKGQPALAQPVVANRRIGVEAVRVAQRFRDESGNRSRRIAAGFGFGWAGWESGAVQPLDAPFERPDHAIGVARGEVTLPAVYPASVEFRHAWSSLVYQTKKTPRAGG